MKYFLKEKSKKILDEGFYIKTDNGENKYFAKTDAQKRSCVNIFDLNEKVLLKIQKKLFRYDVVNSKDELLFSIKSNSSSKKKRYLTQSNVDNINNIRIEGNYSSMNFDIFKPEDILAQVSKKIVHVYDTYCCDVMDEKNALNYIAISIIIDLKNR